MQREYAPITATVNRQTLHMSPAIAARPRIILDDPAPALSKGDVRLDRPLRSRCEFDVDRSNVTVHKAGL
jgi:hypothetical protein